MTILCGVQSEYPNYTPLLAKILEGVLSEDKVEDKCLHLQEVIFLLISPPFNMPFFIGLFIRNCVKMP